MPSQFHLFPDEPRDNTEPFQKLIDDEKRQELRKAIDDMPTDLARIYTMHHEEQMTLKDIATRWGVRPHVARDLNKRLWTYLQQHWSSRSGFLSKVYGHLSKKRRSSCKESTTPCRSQPDEQRISRSCLGPENNVPTDEELKVWWGYYEDRLSPVYAGQKKN